MSATAFQRMRREAAIKIAEEVKEKEIQVNIDNEAGQQLIQENIDNPDILSEEDNNITEDECYKKPLTEMTLEELIEYAKKNDIDIGKATSKTGILEKIIKSQTE
ncbi:hypothetical protein [Clostridium butyricum]|uniref:hypothetical protein n=1 Tax=Clostridium butyricum TaxID=1492 RepID=UPI0013D44BCE|nr:hypothetical protein [Clostridium butyricum]MCQ2017282.1 hypothetical protein [Clostridium butyricum]MCQ2021155.1 hypothetical protein [Clostridium butyricum]NFB72511.1 hypothetical protein [Clostridium butyricum]NFB91564.1 hypothetical protein [Clostridium butyricum]UTY53580.1 hypothetical protein HNS01_10930 [Clostridium butyricum]